MSLIVVLMFGVGMALTCAIQEYFIYEQMVDEYNQWVQETGINNV